MQQKRGSATAGSAAAGAASSGVKDAGWAEYLRQIALGDERAFASLYDESSTLIYSIARRMLSDAADAEEIAMDVYSYVWRSASTWDGSRGSVSAWLIMLCRSRCIDRIRSRVSRAQTELPMPSVHSEHLTWSKAYVSDAGLYDKTVVLRALERLEPDQRGLLELAFFSGFTHTELAERLQLPLGTVKTRVRAAIMRLRDLLKEFAS
jgi:RNA polymerase sigma-70 factor (ECF subfamily)